MKKIITFFLALIFIVAITACNKDENINPVDSGNNNQQEYNPDEGIDFNTDKNVYLVKDGITEYKVVVPDNYTENEMYAAKEFSNYFKIATNVTMKIATDIGLSYDTNDKVISIGKTIYQKSADLSKIDYSKLINGGFIIKSFGNVYILDSNSIEGILYSAYNFLEIYFGIEFLTPENTYIPETTELKAYTANRIDLPTFAIRDYYSYPIWLNKAALTAKFRMNSPSYSTYGTNNAIYKSQYYSYKYEYDGINSTAAREGHTIEPLLAVDAYRNGVNPQPYYKTTDSGANPDLNAGYFIQHPDWYAYDPSSNVTNSRGYVQAEFCYTNGIKDDGEFDSDNKDSFTAKIIEICKNMITEETSDAAKNLMLGFGDYWTSCQCANCLKSKEENGGFSGTYVIWVNAVSKEVKKWMTENNIEKEVNFIIFCYNKSFDAPVTENSDGSYSPINSKVILRDDIIVKIAYSGCVYHSNFDEDCEELESYRIYLKQWKSIGTRFTVWDYVCNFSDTLWHVPNFSSIKNNLLNYQSIKIDNILLQGTPNDTNFYEQNLKFYVCCKLMWNPNQDVNKMIEHFNKLYFGEEYAEYVNRYRDIFENYFAILDNTNGFHAGIYDLFEFKNADTYNPKMLKACIDEIDNAIIKLQTDNNLSVTEKEDLLLKLKSVKITPQYMLLKLGYIINETELHNLLVDFFDSIDSLYITYYQEGWVSAQTFDYLKTQYGL